MVITVTKRFDFAASHQLPYHQGQCRFLHGHNYEVVVGVRSHCLQTEGPSAGMVVDFGDLKALVKPLIAKLDHTHLNDWLPNPTAENIAGAILCYVAANFPYQWVSLFVAVEETPGVSAYVEISYDEWEQFRQQIPVEWQFVGMATENSDRESKNQQEVVPK